MRAGKLSLERFISEFNELGATRLSKKYDLNIRSVFERRRNLERRGYKIAAPKSHSDRTPPTQYPWQINLEIKTGTVLIGSDAHYWPGPAHVTHRAFVRFCKELKPAAVILNGDIIDGPMISRFAPTSWAERDRRPDFADELNTAKERLAEIEKAAFKAHKVFPIGNHDERFEKFIVSKCPEIAKLEGVRLSDHFPLWQICLSCMINDDVFITHNFKGGEHAAHNNTLRSGKTTITGHLHSAKISPVTDLNGTRYGVDTGCLADVDHLAFLYTRMVPRSWRSGFCVLTFQDGLLLQPELVLKWDDDHVQFRGELVRP